MRVINPKVFFAHLVELAGTFSFYRPFTFKKLTTLEGRINLGPSVELTIASGVVTIPAGGTRFTIDTESDAASDDVDTISGGNDGDVITLFAAHTDRTVVLKNGTGNIILASDVSLDDDIKSIDLIYKGSNWYRKNSA